MQIRDLSNKVTSQQLNESLAKKFGYRLSLDKFTDDQLYLVHQQLAEKVLSFERTNNFDSVLENHDYQKNRSMLQVIRQEIKERTLSEEEQVLKSKFLKVMEKAEPNFNKKFGKNSKKKMDDTARKMAKKKDLDEAMDVLRSVLSERTLLEGEEEKAALIMSARDMVDRITGWLEDVASMKAETMLDLVDSIRDELGSDVAQQFSDTVKPALEELYTGLETHRTTLAQAVSILTGEEGPAGPGIATPGAPTMGAEEMPATMAAPEDEAGVASEPATGGEEEAGRAKRESIEYSRRLGQILSSKKK